MELRHLEYFLAVAEHGSILQAAQALSLSQPPLSVAMKQLEQELGTPLFHRGARRIQLTDAGAQLVQRAQDILSLVESTRREMADFADGACGILSLGVISSSAASLLSWRLGQFSARYPDIRYEIKEGNTFSQLDMLNHGLVDLAIVRTPFSDLSVSRLDLDEEPLAAVMRADRDPFMENTLRLGQLKDQPLIFYRRFQRLLIEECEKEGFQPSLRCLNDDARTSLQWAEAGLGIAVIPLSSAAAAAKTMVIKPIANPALTTRTCLIWSQKRALTTTARQFLSFMQDLKNQDHTPDQQTCQS